MKAHISTKQFDGLLTSPIYSTSNFNESLPTFLIKQKLCVMGNCWLDETNSIQQSKLCMELEVPTIEPHALSWNLCQARKQRNPFIGYLNVSIDS